MIKPIWGPFTTFTNIFHFIPYRPKFTQIKIFGLKIRIPSGNPELDAKFDVQALICNTVDDPKLYFCNFDLFPGRFHSMLDKTASEPSKRFFFVGEDEKTSLATLAKDKENKKAKKCLCGIGWTSFYLISHHSASKLSFAFANKLTHSLSLLCMCKRVCFISFSHFPSICRSVCIFVCMSVFLYVCLSFCLSVWLYDCLSVYFSVSHSVSLSVCLSLCLPVYLCLCLSIFLSVCLSVCLSIYMCVCLSIFLSACLSVYLSVSLYQSV
jgi:hypothetical protein